MKALIPGYRNMLHQKTYNEQNYVSSKLTKVGVTPVVNVKYPTTLTLAIACQTAFWKCYRISDGKILL